MGKHLLTPLTLNIDLNDEEEFIPTDHVDEEFVPTVHNDEEEFINTEGSLN